MMNELGKFLKTRIINAGISQKVFAQKLDLSPTALSQIITGKVKPRQATISKIMKLLNLAREDEQTLIKTFENYSSLPEDKSAPKDPIRVYQENRERTFKYLEIKARSILFNEEVEGILRDCGIKYKKNYIRNGLVCDFLLEDEQIGLECKFNAMRDIERTFTTLKILLDNLELKKIALIVPLKSEISESIIKDLERLNISVLSLYELGKFFKR